MIALYIFIINFYRRIKLGFKDEEFRGLFYGVLMLLLLGTIFYHSIEGWGWIDSFYFSVITLSTVGYGDFAPQTPMGKVFTSLYILIGLGILTNFIFKLAEYGEGVRMIRRSDKEDDQEENTHV